MSSGPDVYLSGPFVRATTYSTPIRSGGYAFLRDEVFPRRAVMLTVACRIDH
jgi:hypothetical protein